MTSTDMTRSILMMEKAAVLCPEVLNHLKWVLQTVHQNHHTEQTGTWETCPTGVCKSSQGLMKIAREEGLLDK